MVLDQRKIQELHAAVINVGLERNALLSGIHRAFVASLPRAFSPSTQILSDLHQLNSVDKLSDGSVPLRIWLENAARLAGPRREGRLFEAAVQLVGGGAAPPVATSSPPVVTASAQRKGAVQIFLSAAPEDERYAEALARHFAPLVRNGTIDFWRSSKMPPGAPVETWIEEHITAADLVLLMLSPDYLASDATYSELERALDLRHRKGIRVVPIIARPVALEETPLAHLTLLPRSGVPISASRNADATYTEIVTDLRAIITDLRARPKAAEPLTEPSKRPRSFALDSQPVAPIAVEAGVRGVTGEPDVVAGALDGPGARVGLAIDEIFCRTGVPDDTYVEPEQADEIKRCLRALGRGLVLEGPTQIGKTTAVTKLLGATPHTRLDAYREADVAQVLGIVAKGSLEGHILIENVHALADDALAKIARFMRLLADQRPRTGKVTLIGIANVASRLARLQPDLAGRFDKVEMNRQPPAKVRELVSQGERAANLRFDHTAEIVEASRGSFRLAQELCYQCAAVAEIDSVSAGAPRCVRTLPDDSRVRAAARNALDMVFEDPVARFAEADRQVAAPGACIALLWLLCIAKDGRVVLRAAAERYSQLGAAFRWVQEGHLATWLRAPANADVGALLTIVAGELRAPDPRFLYYLGALDWKRLGPLVGVEVLLPSESLGDLQIIHPVRLDPDERTHANGPSSASSIAKQSLLVVPPPFPWWHPSASRLLSLLTSAYSDVRVIPFICAQVAGFHIGHVAMMQGAELVWRGVIEAAANQGKLKALLEVVWNDPSVAAYHGPLRDAVTPPGARTPAA